MRSSLLGLFVVAAGCSPSVPVALFSGAMINPNAGAQDLHAQGGMVYWHEIVGQNTTMGPIKTMPVTGGTPVVLADMTFGDIAFDADSLYYEVNDTGGIDVMKLPLAGGAATQIAYLPTPEGWGAGPVANGNLFIMVGQEPNPIIWAVPTSGGDPQPFAKMTDGDWPSSRNYSPGMVADQSNLYWSAPNTNFMGATFLEAPLAGGAPTKIGTLAVGRIIDRLAIDHGTFYYSWYTDPNKLPGGIEQIDASGNQTELVSGSVKPGAMVFSGSTVYWTEQWTAPFRLMATHAPGDQLVVASGMTPVRFLSVDGGRLFWLDATTLWSLQL
jgi:hypothetical protein